MSNKQNGIMPANLFVLKHKDLDVAMVRIDCTTGKIEYVLDIFMPEELPLGCTEAKHLPQWWESRAIPDTRRGIQQLLYFLGEETSLSLMLSAYGLSLTDHYWMQPVGQELYWKDLNFYENDFSDELGMLLTDSEKIDIDTNISKFSPSSSVNGEMKKKWIIKCGTRYLLKVNTSDYGQQAVNELIASRLHELTGWKNYVSYTVEISKIEGIEIPCSLNPLFTSTELEFVPAFQLVRFLKKSNDISYYEMIIQQAANLGMDPADVRQHFEYTILSDFILSNTDRHFNNFGFLYSSKEKKIVSAAPIFDTGNSLFYNKEWVDSGKNLLNIQVASFKEREAELLQYVSDVHLIDLSKLKTFPEEVEFLLKKYTKMSKERAGKIAETVRQKIEYLALLQQGKKIWKREKYW